MLFNSLEFALFFGACFAIYYALRHRAQNVFLLLASYLFYAAWDWRFLGLIAISTLVDFAVGLALARTGAPRGRRALVTASVAVNLGILGAFKYAGFFVEGFRDLMGALGIDASGPVPALVLPVGISFYTFQTLSYTIDVYRGRLEPTRNLVDFALFVAFFPQLVAGPIERATRLLPQIRRPRRLTWAAVRSGGWLVLWGTFKKAVIADNVAALADAVYAPGADPTGLEVILGTYAFAVQIYCDFSGYTDVARGAARLLGFELMLNFDLPYLAANPREFWRRWHISLSTWLRDYLYVPLGGNRAGRAKTFRNLMGTMLLGGLWHGAAWTFVAWGAYHGALLVLHRAAAPALAALRPAGTVARRLWHGACVVLFFQLTCVGWVLFRAESILQAGELLWAVATDPRVGQAAAWLPPFALLTLPLVWVQAWQARSGAHEPVVAAPPVLRALVYAGLVLSVVLLGEDFGEPFIYFRF